MRKNFRKLTSIVMAIIMVISIITIGLPNVYATDFTDTITTSGSWTKSMSEIFNSITEGEDNVWFQNLVVAGGGDANSAKIFIDSVDMGFNGASGANNELK